MLCDHEPAQYKEGSGRAQLAQAIASETNPLTARVMVNRIWQYHFGKGIVRTPSNFGRMGERPTHPELLDYLAADFIVERMEHQEATPQDPALEHVRAGHRQPTRTPTPITSFFRISISKHRLDMETLRDSVLAVSGKLDRTVGGAAKPIANDNFRRSLYLTVSRTRLDPAMALFDFPDANNSVDQRTITAGPLQGLYWLNSEFVARAGGGSR